MTNRNELMDEFRREVLAATLKALEEDRRRRRNTNNWYKGLVFFAVFMGFGAFVSVSMDRDALMGVNQKPLRATAEHLDTQEPLWKKDAKVHIHKIVPGVRIEWAYGNGEPTGTCHFFGEDGDRPCHLPHGKIVWDEEQDAPIQTVAPTLAPPLKIAPPPSVYNGGQ